LLQREAATPVACYLNPHARFAIFKVHSRWTFGR
jgi:hypothetical protein